MADPLSSGGAGLALKSLIAGSLGGALALSVMEEIGPFKALFSIIGGALAANYFGPLVLWWLPIPDQFSGAVDFFIGLIFLIALPGLADFVKKASTDPVGTLRSILGKRGGDDA